MLDGYSGVILIGRCDVYMLKELKAICKNIVCSALNPFSAGLDQVCCDGTEIAKLVVQYLLSLGHKRIGYLGMCSGECRYIGYHQTMIERDLNIDASDIFDVSDTEEGGLSAAERYCAVSHPPEIP